MRIFGPIRTATMSFAAWDEDRLTCHTSIQQMNWGVRDLAKTLCIAKDRIRLVSPYVAVGFGGKGTVQSDLALAAVAARVAGRPVKLTLQRPMMFNTTIHRPAAVQRIWIGANRDGRITAIGHDNLNGNLPGGRTEPSTAATRSFYAGAMRSAMLKMMSALQMSTFWLEVLADEMTEASNELADETGALVLRNMARRHRVDAMQMRTQYAALVEQYAERYGDAW